jgi:tRNA(adenine34) deaminase
MDRALEVARTSGDDVPVGALVIDADGRELAAAANARESTGDPTAHAEILALREAARHQAEEHADRGWRLRGCTLVVTLEPCTMCAGALVLARIERLVFGAYDPKAGAVTSLFDVVRDPRLNHRVDVRGGIREAECAQLLLDFFADHR